MLDHDVGDRIFPPTERHRRLARQRGEVARSSDVTAGAILLAASLALWWLIPYWGEQLVQLMRGPLESAPLSSLTIPSVALLMRFVVQVLAVILLPALLLAFIAGLAINVLQVGFVWIPSAVIPRFRGGRGLSWDGVFSTAALFWRFCVLIAVTWHFLQTHRGQLMALGLGEPMLMGRQATQLIGELFLQLSITFFCLAFVDYGWRFWRQEQRLMMTAAERREEQRDEAGNPAKPGSFRAESKSVD